VADSTLNKVIFYRGQFEPALSELIVKLVNAGDICVDVGANTGYFTLLMAKTVGERGKIIAVEPAPGNVKRLLRNLEINNFSDRVEVHEAACGAVPGRATFYINEKNDMHSRLVLPTPREADYWVMSRRWKPIEVEVSTLAAMVGDRAAEVAFLKIDIEGAEHSIANAVVELFTHPKLRVALEGKQPHLSKTLKPFEESGFFAYDLQSSYRWLVHDKVESARPVSFAQLYKSRGMVDVILSRQPLDLVDDASRQVAQSRS
jgi:FkbM family methyltransferase